MVPVSCFGSTPLRSAAARPLIYGHTGGGLMAEGLKTKGRLLVFTFGFDLAQTDWPIQPSFIPFLDLTLQYARAATALETSWPPGDLYSLALPEDRQVTEVVVRREGAEDADPLRQPVAADAGSLRFRVPDEPGIYRLSLDDDSAPFAMLAVNPASDESRLVYEAEPPALAAWTLDRSAEPEDVQAAPLALDLVPRSEIFQQRIWWWLVVVGIVTLFFETALLGLRREAP